MTGWDFRARSGPKVPTLELLYEFPGRARDTARYPASRFRSAARAPRPPGAGSPRRLRARGPLLATGEQHGPGTGRTALRFGRQVGHHRAAPGTGHPGPLLGDLVPALRPGDAEAQAAGPRLLGPPRLHGGHGGR